jgi:hypothetical protein
VKYGTSKIKKGCIPCAGDGTASRDTHGGGARAGTATGDAHGGGAHADEGKATEDVHRADGDDGTATRDVHSAGGGGGGGRTTGDAHRRGAGGGTAAGDAHSTGAGIATLCPEPVGLPSATVSAGSVGPCTFCCSYLAKPCPHPSRGFFLGASSSTPRGDVKAEG